MLGYGLLAWAYSHAFEMKPNQRWLAWFLAILYAVTDEYHQSFVAGRFSSVWDVLVFDNLGALISIRLAQAYGEKRPAPVEMERTDA